MPASLSDFLYSKAISRGLSSTARGTQYYVPKITKRDFNFQKIVITFTSICITGCSTFFSPTVGMLAPEKIPTHATDNMPGLTAVVNETNDKLQLLESKRNSSLQTNRALGVTTFGLGLAAAGYGLYGGHANAMKNLAFASGATYVGSSLFTPTAQADIYHAGIQALSCINDKATRTLYQIDENIIRFNSAPRLSAETFGCKPDENKLIIQNNAYEKANWSIINAKANDYGLAQVARSATNNVLVVLDGQLISLTPSPDAILNAARSISPAGGMSSSISNPSAKSSYAIDKLSAEKSAQSNKCLGQDLESANALLDERTANYHAIENSLAEAMNNLDALSTACVMSERSIAPVTLSQDEVTVTKDIKYVNVVISGGREPYLLTQSATPGLIINFIQPRTINIITADGLVVGEYKIEIRDNSTVTIPKILTIKTK